MSFRYYFNGSSPLLLRIGHPDCPAQRGVPPFHPPRQCQSVPIRGTRLLNPAVQHSNRPNNQRDIVNIPTGLAIAQSFVCKSCEFHYYLIPPFSHSFRYLHGIARRTELHFLAGKGRVFVVIPCRFPASVPLVSCFALLLSFPESRHTFDPLLLLLSLYRIEKKTSTTPADKLLQTAADCHYHPLHPLNSIDPLLRQ